MKEEPLLSICISSYNKGQKCKDLVSKILSLDDDRIDIVVCDDCSDENTQDCLRSIEQRRVKVYINSSNIGACPNWYETIDHGDGKYLLHVLDRDYIDIEVLKDFVNKLELYNAGVGYIGNIWANPRKRTAKKSVEIYDAGEKTVAEIGGIPIHPTGFFVRRDEWNRGEYKKYFYNEHKYGIYPHSYLMGIIGLNRKVFIFQRKFCRYVYSQSSKSRFYQGKHNIKYWWEPESIFDTSEKMLFILCKNFLHDSYRTELIENIFIDSIFRGTVEYKNELLNKRQMSHYSLKTKNVSLEKLFLINTVYTYRFLRFLYKNEFLSSKMQMKILKVACVNVKDIIKYY